MCHVGDDDVGDRRMVQQAGKFRGTYSEVARGGHTSLVEGTLVTYD